MLNARTHSLNEDECPVPEDLLGRLHGANPAEAALVARDLPEIQRARLAAFCYERRHLHQLGLMIASTCSVFHLRKAFGSAGDIVYRQSRRPEETIAEERRNANHHVARPVTLATLARRLAHGDDATDGASEAAS